MTSKKAPAKELPKVITSLPCDIPELDGGQSEWCCGLFEYHGTEEWLFVVLSGKITAYQAAPLLAAQLYFENRSAVYVMTEIVRLGCKKRRSTLLLPAFRRWSHTWGMGGCVLSDENLNINSGNTIHSMMWTPNHARMDEWTDDIEHDVIIRLRYKEPSGWPNW